MRAAGIILVLLSVTATASAQATFDLISAPDAAIRTVSWALPGSPPPPQPRPALTPEYQVPERSKVPTVDDSPNSHLPTSADPPGGRMPSSSTRPEPKKRVPVVGAYIEVENRGEKVIKAVGWEVVLMDKVSGLERGRFRFSTATEVPPGLTVAQKHEFPLDSDWLWFAASKGRGVRVVVEIKHLVFAGGDEWRRDE